MNRHSVLFNHACHQGATGNGSLGVQMALFAVLALLCLTPAHAAEHQARPTAFFGFVLDDTSLQGETQGVRPDESRRLASIDAALQDALVRSGCCIAVDLTPVAARAHAQNLQSCGGCDVDLARQAGAALAVSGWVQKVSNLILNINVVVRDVASGRVVGEGSVDIRGNTDESWSRGLAFLVRNRLRPGDW